MKLKLESIKPDSGSSFKILLTPNLNNIFYWHFHSEIEIVYVEAEKGIRHIGEHISVYEKSDLALIGSYIPHLNFDYGAKTTVETVVVQLRQDFFESGLEIFPELNHIVELFERAKTGIAFYGNTKDIAGNRLKKLISLEKFEQFFELLSIFQFLAKSNEYVPLKVRAISSNGLIKHQERIHKIYQYVEENFKETINTNDIAKKVNLSVPAFCRYFKNATNLTYTDFVNKYRINHAKKLLLQDINVGEACFESGFENISYFNRAFKKIAGESPSSFKKRNLDL
ncbi:MAG TPA: AraC family transcriptional regulator [Puia sp.]|nr:AraC family transcriptional regulator [Puia sp.]